MAWNEPGGGNNKPKDPWGGGDQQGPPDLDEALRGAELLIVQTEWEEYRRLRPERLVSLMTRPVVVDARRALDPVLMERGGVTSLGVGFPFQG